VARLSQGATFISLDDCSMSRSSDAITSFHLVTNYAKRLRQGTGSYRDNRKMCLT